MLIHFSDLDVALVRAKSEFDRAVEADIRNAHGELVARPVLTGVPEHVYNALFHFQDEDQKAYEAELEAQRREELGR